MKVVVTSGPTRAYIDEIRYISNYSTGKLGSLVAEKLARQGHKVTLVYGSGSILPVNKNIKKAGIETVRDLIKTLKKEIKDAGAVVHAMAVLDYEPEKLLRTKVKSDKKNWTVRFKRTPKVIDMIKKLNPKTQLIGFKLEYKAGSKTLKASALKLSFKSGADYVVANDYSDIKKGVHKAVVFDKNGRVIFKAAGKEKIADGIVKILGQKVRN
ncbi:MAG: phosphopantothenoylcysteine decarboxylase [Candidatus Firestonebacteria bacterium]